MLLADELVDCGDDVDVEHEILVLGADALPLRRDLTREEVQEGLFAGVSEDMKHATFDPRNRYSHRCMHMFDTKVYVSYGMVLAQSMQ